MKTVASRLRNCRIGLGLTQAGLAQKIKVSRSAVAQWESHSGTLPSTASLTSLAAVLHCRFEWLAIGRGSRNVDGGSVGEASTAAAVDLRFFAKDDAEEQLIAAFRELDERDQDVVSTLVSSLRAKRGLARRRVAAYDRGRK